MSYQIRIVRKGDKGRLTFASGAASVDADCWWDPNVRVDAGTYTGYATRMATKKDGFDGGKREAIWLGYAVPVNGGSSRMDGIFIHKGTGPAWSDGCIVIQSAQAQALWTAITPKNQANVTIVIEDVRDSFVEPKPKSGGSPHPKPA